MKKILIAIIITVLGLQGCSISIISIPGNRSGATYPMFGGSAERNFYVPRSVSDSLELKWENGGSGGFANTSVTISDSIVFVPDLSGRIYAYNIHNGKELGKIKNKGAVYGAPIVKNFWIIFAVASLDDDETEVFFYDFTTGKIFRDEIVPGRVQTEIAETGDGFVLATEAGRIQKLGEYGLPGWHIDLGAFIHSSPACKDNLIVIGNDLGEVTGIDQEDGKIIYRNKIGGPFRGGGSISGDTFFIGSLDGYIYALDLKTGAIRWKYNTGARIVMTPVAGGNFVYVGNLAGDLLCLDKNTGEKKWVYHSPGLFDVSPLVTDNLIFIPDLGRILHIINTRTGTLDKIMQLGGRGKLNPVLFNNLLIIGFDRGVLQAYEFK